MKCPGSDITENHFVLGTAKKMPLTDSPYEGGDFSLQRGTVVEYKNQKGQSMPPSDTVYARRAIALAMAVTNRATPAITK
jgi:hypothetical protein